MTESPVGPHMATPAELRERLAAERCGTPFLLYRDEDGVQRIIELADATRSLRFGRSVGCDVCLAGDPEVSRIHAELERTGPHWLLVDDGLSSNGTFVRGERVVGRRRLADGDVFHVGRTSFAFRDVANSTSATTRMTAQQDAAVAITDAQSRVLIALCRPFKGGLTDATPATNPEIAAELFLTVAGVKSHLRVLCRAFGIDHLPQQQKRRRLVAFAFSSGIVRDRDL
jgi:pSer/pThr/pTyr-binding forkhead associated (FHA) protein